MLKVGDNVKIVKDNPFSSIITSYIGKTGRITNIIQRINENFTIQLKYIVKTRDNDRLVFFSQEYLEPYTIQDEPVL